MRLVRIGLSVIVSALAAVVLCFPVYAAPDENIDKTADLPEVFELRRSNVKAYRLNDGQIKFEIYASDIHYLDENDFYQEIDNSIVDANYSDYKYKNNKNSYTACFGDSKIYLDDGKYPISFELQNISSGSSLLRSSENRASSDYDRGIADDNRAVIYKDVLPEVDIAYTATDHALKEDIILRSYTGINEFTFKITTAGLTPVLKNDCIVFTNDNGEEVSSLGKLIMYDANGKYSENLQYSLVIVDGNYYVTVTADKEFLQSPSTVYPVVIDPTYNFGSSTTTDTFVSQAYPGTNYGTSDFLVLSGLSSSTYGEAEIFIKFSDMFVPLDFPVSSATLQFTKKDSYGTGLVPELYATESIW